MRLLLLFLTGFLPLCAADADLILFHGKIITVDKAFSIRQAVAIRGNRIVATGADTSILASQRGAHTRLIDLEGRTVLPGLFDSHMHPLEAALSEFRAPIPALNSFAAIQGYIRSQAAKTPKGKWIVVPRTFPTRLRETRMPDRHVLDVDTEHPVMFDASYVLVVNSLGLKLSGITRGTPNPPRGEILYDAAGEPNGILKNARGLLKGLDSSAEFSEQEKLQALEDMLNRYVAAGLTSIGDGAVQDEEIHIYRLLKAQNRLPLRVTMTWWHDASKPLDVLQREIRSSHATTGTGDEWLRFGAFKINVDGGMTIGTAYQRAPYGAFGRQLYGMTNPDDRGQLFESPDKLLAIMRTARERNWQLSAHAQGGGAVDGFLDAMEALDREHPIRPSRSHLIHASFQSPEAIARMKRLGILADVQSAWLELDSGALTKVFGYNGMRYFFPLRSYLNAGIVLAGGSDHMIGHDKDAAVNPYNPFRGMWTAVTRRNSQGETLHAEEKIGRPEALRMYTTGAAYRHFAESQRGSIEAGKLADLVVIDKDYLNCPEDEIRKIQPLLVMIDGRIRVNHDLAVSTGKRGN
jgi:predicted amidohydrolase YtcJ